MGDVYKYILSEMSFPQPNPPVAVPSLISTIAHTGTKNCPSMRRETLTWPSLSATV